MFIISNNTLETLQTWETVPNEIIGERLQAIKATVNLAKTEKAKKRIYGEIKYLENLILEKESNYER